jgi:hypothetical protein
MGVLGWRRVAVFRLCDTWPAIALRGVACQLTISYTRLQLGVMRDMTSRVSNMCLSELLRFRPVQITSRAGLTLSDYATSFGGQATSGFALGDGLATFQINFDARQALKMLEKLIEYLVTRLTPWPKARAVIARYRLLRIKGNRFLRTHPVIALLVLIGVVVLLVTNPDYLPEILRPAHKCHVIETEKGELYRADGDTLQFGEERPCEHQQLVGLEFFNLSSDYFHEDKAPYRVSAGIFLRETARNVPAPGQWHEYSMYHESNNFLWNNAMPTALPQESFLKGSCEGTQRGDTESRQGLLLRSDAMRSNPGLDKSTRLECNYGTTPDQPEYKVCNYLYLEFFIPTVSPIRLCPNKVSLWDRWFAPGTKKITLTDSASYEKLSALARVRSWAEAKATPVPTERWEALSKGLPKICMRWMGPKGEWLGDQSKWQEFASLGSAWCDY